ncbi:MAG: SGNH/GDSL hydrolase family protein [Actinomycetes bacterium]
MFRRALAAVAACCVMAGLAAANVPGSASAAPAAPAASAPRQDELPEKIVAIGDSFTAGFGFYGNGSEMGVTDLPGCMPADTPNDACSSNSNTGSKDAPGINFTTDYGFNNQVSWAAGFAATQGITTQNAEQYYRNFAVTGSTAEEWAKDKLKFTQFDNLPALDVVAEEDPDLILMTLGGNPSLTNILFGGGNKCAVLQRYDCFQSVIDSFDTRQNLEEVYRRLLKTTDALILPMLYPQIVPAATLFSAEGLLVARQALNDTIAQATNNVRNELPAEAWRLVWTHKDFRVGIAPGRYWSFLQCFGATAYGLNDADGPSDQSTATQAVFAFSRKFTGWCPGSPWIISGDTGIHPNQKGYRNLRDAALWLWEHWPPLNTVVARSSRGDIVRTNCTPSLLYAKALSIKGKAGRRATFRYAYQGKPATLKIKAWQVRKAHKYVNKGIIGRTTTHAPSGKLSIIIPKKAGSYTLQLIVNGGRCGKIASEQTDYVSLTAS